MDLLHTPCTCTEKGGGEKGRWKRGKRRVELEEGGGWGGRWEEMKENEMRGAWSEGGKNAIMPH